MALTPDGCCVVALGEQTALIRDGDGSWRVEGRGEFAVYANRKESDLTELAGKAIW